MESLELGFHEGKGKCNIISFNGKKPTIKKFNNLFLKDEILFEEPSLDFFSFNSPFGACKKCEGFGKVTGIDSDLVIPNPNLSVYEDAIVCWKGEKMSVALISISSGIAPKNGKPRRSASAFAPPVPKISEVSPQPGQTK